MEQRPRSPCVGPASKRGRAAVQAGQAASSFLDAWSGGFAAMLGERQEATPDLLDAVQEAGKDRLEALAEPGLTAFAEPEADEYDEVEENVHVELMPVKQELQQEQNVKEDTSASSSNVKQEVQQELMPVLERMERFQGQLGQMLELLQKMHQAPAGVEPQAAPKAAEPKAEPKFVEPRAKSKAADPKAGPTNELTVAPMAAPVAPTAATPVPPWRQPARPSESPCPKPQAPPPPPPPSLEGAFNYAPKPSAPGRFFDNGTSHQFQNIFCFYWLVASQANFKTNFKTNVETQTYDILCFCWGDLVLISGDPFKAPEAWINNGGSQREWERLHGWKRERGGVKLVAACSLILFCVSSSHFFCCGFSVTRERTVGGVLVVL